MAGVLEDTNDLLRHVQKLAKELGPVKTALAALAKRESVNPNPQAAAASLEKVANRVADVAAKYQPFTSRMGHLVEEDVPAALMHTAFVATPASQLAEAVEVYRRRQTAREEKRTQSHGVQPMADTNVLTDTDNEEDASDGNERGAKRGRQGSPLTGRATPPASLLAGVCPDRSPFLIPPEYYQLYHDQLQLRVEMVQYLISTGRADAAAHVAAGYGLPLVWFPTLAVEAAMMSNGSTIGGEGGPASPSFRNVSLANASFATASSPLITPALGPRTATLTNGSGSATLGSSTAGVPPVSPVQLPAAVQIPVTIHRSNDGGGRSGGDSPSSAPQRSSASPPRVGTQAFLDEMPVTATATAAHGQATPQQRLADPPTAAIPASPPTPHHTNGAGRTNGGGGGSPSVPARHGQTTACQAELPDLAARVLATALFLKDEYMDRMVMERLVAHNGFDHRWDETEGSGRPGSSYSTRDGTQQRPVVRTADGSTWRPPQMLPPVQPHTHPDSSTALHRRADGATRSGNGTNGVNGSRRPSDDADRRMSVLEKDVFEEAVVERARRVPRSHLCTQSGSTQFDDAMMHVIEEALAAALDQHQTSDDARPEELQREEEGNGSTEQRRQRRTSARASRRWLTPDELLTAEEAFSNDLLFIKRSSRYYCPHSHAIMDGSGEGGAQPMVLPNGMVVSDQASTTDLVEIRVSKTNFGATIDVGTVCPPSPSMFAPSSLKRIFVT